MNRSSPSGTPGNAEDFRARVVSRYLAGREDLRDARQMATPRVAIELAEDLRRGADALRSGRLDQLTAEERARSAAAAEAAAEAFEAAPEAGGAEDEGSSSA